jgi:hypothetical protein
MFLNIDENCNSLVYVSWSYFDISLYLNCDSIYLFRVNALFSSRLNPIGPNYLYT